MDQISVSVAAGSRKPSFDTPLLLIEEPEAHLHPQRQVRLMEFLRRAADGKIEGVDRPVQVLLSTHSAHD